MADDGGSGRIRRGHARQRPAESPRRHQRARLFALGCVAGAGANVAVTFAPCARSRPCSGGLRTGRRARVRVSAGHEDRRRLDARAPRHGARPPRRRADARVRAAPHLLAAFGIVQPRGGRCSLQPRRSRSPAPRSSRSCVRDGPHVTTSAPFDPHAARRPDSDAASAAGHARLPRAHVGALRDVGMDWRVCRRRVRGARRAGGRSEPLGLDRGVRRRRQRRAGMRRRRALGRPSREGARRARQR